MDGLLPPPPPGLNYTAAIRPSLNFILILTPLGAALVPLVLTLLFFSTAQTRRHPVFILNILACCIGICAAAINATLETKQILYPLEPVSNGLVVSGVAFAVVSPLFIDSILLFRVLAFYPLNITPRHILVYILALPVLVKSGRFIVVVMYMNSFTHASENLPNIMLVAQSTWPRNPYVMTEWSLQMVDNLYASVFFLYKLYLYQKPKSDITVIRSRSLLSHVRSLFLIALGNFVFPVIMNIASIVLIATDPSFIKGTYILMTNNYVAILGVVFATIWARKQTWDHHDINVIPSRPFDPTPNLTSVLSAIQFEAEMHGTNSQIDDIGSTPQLGSSEKITRNFSQDGDTNKLEC